MFAGSVPEKAEFYSEEHEVIEALTYEEVVALDDAGKLRSPIVRKAIEDCRNGNLLPLSTVQTWHADTLTSITVEKDH